MPNSTVMSTDMLGRPLSDTAPVASSSPPSAVAWGAIVAGAAAAAALSLILVMLGTGLGLSAVSPWSDAGVTGTTFTVSTIIWLTFTQIAASGMGGYLAGRLRTRWAAVHSDEVYFRDTAHGFLAWAIATLVTAALLSSAIGSIVSTGVQAGGAVVGGAASTALTAGAAAAGGAPMNKSGDSDSGPMGYFVDSMFRADPTAPARTADAGAGGNTAGAAEASRIFVNSLRDGKLSEADARYLGQLVAQRTGLSQEDAAKRVNETFTRMQAKLKEAEVAAREAADKARKAAAYATLWLFISLLVGAFVASFMATYGGRRRDLHA